MFVFTSSASDRESAIRSPIWAAQLYNALLEDTGLAALGGVPATPECMESLNNICLGFGCEQVIDETLHFVRVRYVEFY